MKFYSVCAIQKFRRSGENTKFYKISYILSILNGFLFSDEDESDDDEHYAAGVDEYLKNVEKRQILRSKDNLK